MFTPKYFQEKATELAVQELSTADNALVVMCCDSGKTYTGAMIADRLHALVTVIVAPTIMLVDQIADEYRQTTDRRVFQYHSENAIETEVFLGEHPGKGHSHDLQLRASVAHSAGREWHPGRFGDLR